jgi:hypothetical protein
VAAVGADGDMVDAGDLDGLAHLAPVLDRGAIRVAGDVAIGGAADNAIVAQGRDHVVGLVALVREQAVGVGVGDRDRLLREADGVHGGAVADVRQVDQHAAAVHLLDDLAAVAGEAGILVLVAAAAQRVLVVVGQLDAAHAEFGEQLDQADAALEQLGVLVPAAAPCAPKHMARMSARCARSPRIGVGGDQVAPAASKVERLPRLPKPQVTVPADVGWRRLTKVSRVKCHCSRRSASCHPTSGRAPV